MLRFHKLMNNYIRCKTKDIEWFWNLLKSAGERSCCLSWPLRLLDQQWVFSISYQDSLKNNKKRVTHQWIAPITGTFYVRLLLGKRQVIWTKRVASMHWQSIILKRDIVHRSINKLVQCDQQTNKQTLTLMKMANWFLKMSKFLPLLAVTLFTLVCVLTLIYVDPVLSFLRYWAGFGIIVGILLFKYLLDSDEIWIET